MCGIAGFVTVASADGAVGILGRMADVIFLEAYMRGLLTKRNEVIRWYAESGQWEEVLGRPRP